MAGALTERDFVQKVRRAGFVEIEVLERAPMGIDDCALYPMFTDELLATMRKLIPADQHDRIAVAAVVRATRSARHPDP